MTWPAIAGQMNDRRAETPSAVSSELSSSADSGVRPELQALLSMVAASHRKLCPRQVLGVRMGLFAGRLLGLEVPRTDRRLVTIVETDGCFADAVAVATGCAVGARTLRVADYGKVAAVFAHAQSGQSVRLVPHAGVREASLLIAPMAPNRWVGQLLGYQRLPDEDLFTSTRVRLDPPLHALLSRPGIRVPCDACGEEILNEREIRVGSRNLCRGCAGGAYYKIRAMT